MTETRDHGCTLLVRRSTTIGFLQLSEDLGFSKDHGFQSTSQAEEVTYGLRVMQSREDRFVPRVADALEAIETADECRLELLCYLVGCFVIDLQAIASRENKATK